MKKPLLYLFIFLTICACGLYGSLYFSSYTKQRNYRQVSSVSAKRAAAPETDLGNKFADRIKRKSDQLTRLGIIGSQRHDLMRQEAEAAFDEGNRVRASHYKSPFDEKTLPIKPK